MAVLQPTVEAPIEAVIISGTRKGELITLGEEEQMWTPQTEAALEALVTDARRMAENAHAAATEADALLQELRSARINRQ